MVADNSVGLRSIVLLSLILFSGFLFIFPVAGTGTINETELTNETLVTKDSQILNETEISVDIGEVRFASGDYEGALAWYEEQLTSKNDLERAPVLNNIGSCYVQLSRDEEALTSFLAAADADPGYTTGWLNAGVVYETLGKPADALSCYNKVIMLDPENGRAYVLKGSLLADSGETGDALIAYEKALEWASGDLLGEALNGKGAIYFLLGKNDEALRSFFDAIDADPNGAAMARTNLGVLYVSQNRFDEALLMFKEAMDRDPLGETGAVEYYDALSAMMDVAKTPDLPDSLSDVRG
ncbi:MAG: tetratricopeptide repeat protein [Methanospirillaceae archaeon]|nr:tetratricopeptide repeat protein [Methanospirillaceae archaeon]